MGRGSIYIKHIVLMLVGLNIKTVEEQELIYIKLNMSRFVIYLCALLAGFIAGALWADTQYPK